MKKSMLIILCILLIGTNAYGARGHWADNIVETGFKGKYFSHLIKNGQIDYEKSLRGTDYLKALDSFYRNYNLNYNRNFGSGNLSRRDLINIYGPVVEDLSLGKKLPFNDTFDLNPKEKEYLEKLYDLKILNGISPNEFGVNKDLTQAEGIITMQNLKNILHNGNDIDFKIISRERLENANEHIKIKDLGSKIELTIVYGFEGPGRNLSIDKIKASARDESYNIISRMELSGEVDTSIRKKEYEEVKIHIDKKDLIKGKAYDFRLIGVQFPSGL